MSNRIPSVKDTYFQHKVLTKVHGKPTYEALRTLTTELKANAGSVPTTIGGGLYGHLGLILTDIRYATLPGTVPWTTPLNPGVFAPPAAGTAAQIDAAKDVWKEAKLSFDLVQATEKALIAQVVDSLDPIYIRALLNRDTGQYSTSIRAVITHLFDTYGKITPQQVTAKQMELYNLHYDISQPVDMVFNAIQDLVELSDQANSPMTENQMVDLAYVIFAKQPILQQDLRLWNKRIPVERTWVDMVAHFRDAQSDLNALPTAGNIYHQHTNHHQANNVEVIADLVAQRLLTAIQPSDEPTPTAVPVKQDNSLQQRESDLQAREQALLTQMQEMMTLMRNSTTTTTPRTDTTGRGRGGRNSNTNRHTQNGRGRGRSIQAAPRQYCWTHGTCAHSSLTCNTKAPGHIDTATFTNMQGGNMTGCFWVQT